MAYKFNVKETVTYSPAVLGGSHRHVQFEIVRHLPSERGMNQYRVKSLIDGHERVALESELS